MRKFHERLCQLCYRTITRCDIRIPHTSADFFTCLWVLQMLLSCIYYMISCVHINPNFKDSNFSLFLFLGCQDLIPPENGYKVCNSGICNIFCNDGYGIRYGQITTFVCGDNGWLPPLSQVPVCNRK